MVYACALQRAAQAPRKEHLCKANRLVKWLRRNPIVTVFKPIKANWKVIVVSDAAFRKESATGLSIRGAVIGVGQFHDQTPGGPCHVLEATVENSGE